MLCRRTLQSLQYTVTPIRYTYTMDEIYEILSKENNK